MKGFVLAAGFGSRLSPLTNTLPKPLFPVGGLPLIGYALRLLAHHGITEVAVNVHHLGKLIKDALGDGARFGVRLTYSDEAEILGTGGGLKRMQRWLGDDAVVVLNSDTIIDLDLGAVLREHTERSALATMVLRPHAGHGDYGQIEIDAGARIRRILGTGEEREGLTSLMFAGVHVLEPRFLEYLPPDVNTCVVRYGYAKALSNGEPLYSHLTQGFWVDAGTPDLYFEANVAALAGQLRLAHCDPLADLSPESHASPARMGRRVTLGNGVELHGPVALGDGVRVADEASLGPNVWVSSGAHIGRGAQLRDTIVLDGARVAARTKLQRAIVGKKATLALGRQDLPDERPSVGP